MDAKQLNRITTKILEDYYRNDVRTFFHYASDDMLWIGPRQGQLLFGKEQMEQAWAREKHALVFKMGNLEFITEKTARDVFSQIAFFKVATIFPDGRVHVHDQRILLLWKAKAVGGRSVYRIKTTFISNAAPRNEGDVIYAVHDGDTSNDAIKLFVPHGANRSIAIRTSRSTTTYAQASTVLRVESTDRGNRTAFVTKEGTVRCIDPIGTVAKQTEGILMRCHSGYLVNPAHVTAIERFRLTMDDGADVPIPEKKYTAFRRRFEAWKKDAEDEAIAFIEQGGAAGAPGNR